MLITTYFFKLKKNYWKLFSFLKGSFKIYPILDKSDNLQQNLFFNNIKQVIKEECLIRVYIVRGIDLQAKDSNGKVKFKY